ncbi:Serine-enriched protein [Mizuhopecten yessoensis]|uniref:Serine-enriched protein n=1 Tax=Mizuhopecten yessoensis TaxID=6573 RepID=A0A210R2G6_MIZYE|nr:Serine-enriched protein [Mizuhopecten yessoensis]
MQSSVYLDDFWNKERVKPDVMVVKDTRGLCEDLKYVISVPDLCDVTFLVGEEKLPVYGVKAILATRSRHMYQLLLAATKNAKKKSLKNNSAMKKALKKIQHLLSPSSSEKVKTFYQSDVVQKLTVEVKNFDVTVFERFMCYIHCGTVAVDISNVVGLMNAAHTYDFPELRDACWEFANNYIKPDTLSQLTCSARTYIHFKYTRMLMQRIRHYLSQTPDIMSNCPELCGVGELQTGEYML